MSNSFSLDKDQILEVLSLSQNATAIYAGDNIIVQSANDAMLAFWGKDRSIIGKPLEEAVPELKGQPFKKMLQEVLRTGVSNIGNAIPATLMVDGKLQISYYNYQYRAIKDQSGKIYCILHTASDVTEKELNKIALKKAKEQEEAQTKALLESERNLRRFILQAPVAIALFKGPDFIVEIANNRALELWGRNLEEVSKKPILEAMPELKSQGIKQLLDNVYTTGETFSATELPVKILRNGKYVNAYVNFIYEAQYDAQGNINGLMTIGTEVTDEVLARKSIEQSSGEQLALNEELQASNEALIAINEELTETQAYLQQIVDALEESESRFRYLVQQAPVAIFILNGRSLRIETMNNLMLKMLGKTADIVGKTYIEALPEFVDQLFFKLLDNIFDTGETFYGNEVKAVIEFDGILKEGYYNFTYQPIKDNNGITNGIICVSVDVTEQVNARKKVERAEESLRMAVDAAELGSYYINVVDRIFVPSPKLKEFFGYAPGEEVPYEAAINQIHPDYRQAAADMVEAAITYGIKFDMEYPIIGHNDGKVRWVRGLGTVQHDNNGIDTYFTGILHEITEKKQDEMRKNDFIGMVSHELKTPLTSLTAIVQVMNAKLKYSDDPFIANAMGKANIQVKKMSNMINGFLNISRLESGKIFIEKNIFEIDALILEVIDEIQMTAFMHSISLVSCPPIKVNADRDKIGSVISNLLTNAIKYSPKAQQIIVNCEKIGNTVQVSIKDEGMGIKPDDLDKLFDRYYRVESKHTSHISGFGIGLYLSAEIVQRHGGKIWAESESGVGSTFYFILPLS
ncbi:ATP-binding protein [Mucilaginibacter sp. L196]|uniref:PAS domain-containing sensor histidine kinase n=1 Tax=Mucilaginibacter sp. L196 TaxID=1641870 RepID=UPI00131A7522|nr:ATP-binding protein [Mucilaginibacter sp. L196]